MLAALAVVTTLAAGFASSAGAYGGGANHDMWQIGFSINCNNPTLPSAPRGSAAIGAGSSSTARPTGPRPGAMPSPPSAFTRLGGGGAGAGHTSIEIESWSIAAGSAGPQTFFASGEMTDTFRGSKETTDFADQDTGVSAVPGHYSTSEILGFKAPPGVAIQIQVAFRPAK